MTGKTVAMLSSILLRELRLVNSYAQAHSKCLRKPVGCSVVAVTKSFTGHEILWTRNALTHNGPSRDGFPCTNEVGRCGCSHAEPRALLIVSRLKEVGKMVLCCSYSPCTNCANLILDYGKIQHVVYGIPTEHDMRGLEFLQSGGIQTLSEKDLMLAGQDDISIQKVRAFHDHLVSRK